MVFVWFWPCCEKANNHPWEETDTSLQLIASIHHQPAPSLSIFQPRAQGQVEQRQTGSLYLSKFPPTESVSIINNCFIPLSFGVICYAAICNKTMLHIHYVFHLFIMFIVFFLPPEYKLYRGREFYLFSLLVHARWPVTFFIIIKMVLYIVKVPEHISLN